MKKGLILVSVLVAGMAMLVLLGGFEINYSVQKSRAVRKPNIIVIMADDMGFSDLGCYGGEIRTPNLDYLASNGIRYTQFYNTSRCCPTRASLLTGLYNQQAGIGKMTDLEDEPGYRGHLTENTVTLAEVLKMAGYQTAMTGKWHVSNTTVQKDPKEQLAWLNHQKEFGNFAPLDQYPTSRGFDKYFGNIWGVVDFLTRLVWSVARLPFGRCRKTTIIPMLSTTQRWPISTNSVKPQPRFLFMWPKRLLTGR